MALKHSCGRLKAFKGQTTQTQNQTTSSANTYGWQTPPDTADTTALRNFQFQHDPRIDYSFARGRQNMANTYANPLGGATTPQLRDATLRAGYEDSAQQNAQADAEENYGFQGMKYGQASDLAHLTAPRLTQTGGSSTGSGVTTVQQPFDWSSVISGGASMGSALLA